MVPLLALGHAAGPQDKQLLAGDAAAEGSQRAERGEGAGEGHRADHPRGGFKGNVASAKNSRDAFVMSFHINNVTLFYITYFQVRLIEILSYPSFEIPW